MTKRCGRCRQVLPVEQFSRAGTSRQHWCKPCFRDHRQGAARERNIRLTGLAETRRRERLHRHVLRWLERHPCVDCGNVDPVVLEFDHVGLKTADVTALVIAEASIDEIQREIDRCEVVCANCHRRRTARRGAWKRLGAVSPVSGERRWRRIRNLAFVLDVLARASCVDCGLDDVAVLEFDHVGPKRCSVMRMAWTEYGLATIAAEIARCEICCCNCHRIRTARRAAQFRYRAGIEQARV